MSICFGCYFHRSGWMENECDYFGAYNYREPTVRDGCFAFSTDGTVSEENEAQIFDQTDGVFGKPRDKQQEYEVRMRYAERKEE